MLTRGADGWRGAIEQPGSRRFWPTRLALTLTSANTAAAETHMEGFIVLETNFDLYAYTGAVPSAAPSPARCRVKLRNWLTQCKL